MWTPEVPFRIGKCFPVNLRVVIHVKRINSAHRSHDIVRVEDREVVTLDSLLNQGNKIVASPLGHNTFTLVQFAQRVHPRATAESQRQ